MTPYVVEYVLAHLRLLEAVGRLGSFSAAATELGVTQPNVSRQIGQIERVIGHPLFTRGHRGVILTEAGCLLFDAATESTGRIRNCLGEIAATAVGRRQIAVVTDYGFGATWLMERLSDFERICPDVEVQIVTTRNLSETASGDIRPDVSILFEQGPVKEEDPVFQRKMLFQEEVYPVCGRTYREQHGPFDSVEEIRKAQLLHLKGDGKLWLNWESWFRKVGSDRPQTLSGQLNVFRSFSHFPLLMQSACQNEGIALGWHPLIDTALETGQLVKLWPTPVKSENGYVLTLHRRTSREASAFYTWVIAQAESGRVVR